jgi:hypothetical protein
MGGDRHPSLGRTELRILRILAAGPQTTRSITEAILIEEEGLRDPRELRMQPHHRRLERRRVSILSALNRLQRKGLITGENYLAALTPQVTLQGRWWRLLTDRERWTGRVDRARSHRLARRLWPQIQPRLKRQRRIQTLMRKPP